MFDFKVTPEHEWLQRLVGDWTFEATVEDEPDQMTHKSTGKESIRMLGANWMIGEGQGEMPCPEGEQPQVGYTCITLGYSPEKKAMVGTWIGSMMNHMWVYEGSLDLDQGILVLNASGPKFDGTGTANYRETIHLLNDNERTFASAVQTDDGEWVTFMKAVYKRA